ncbi:HYR domain-containing protein [Mangrovimonas sp. AS39]|uniref:malectin domain-containing carbohydrate-binding protein n=1 Tax=Mangrovimonas futianensis TaxID=2895523 RepID=UPI001E5ABB39|nr:malectin domain-containing carbohydrate-binding protein [Mangrovimonas futianensis]MCF1191256.1 HYR domain-containing protein [Mangrovimonas futianensis]MCF1194951.1 HYR domain-containing protein [Mangrovimonas futianensis]
MSFNCLKTNYLARWAFLAILSIFWSQHTHSQTISFGSTGLIGEGVLNPTSLEFGPDDRLYVSQQNGTIWAYTIERDNAPAGNGTYTVTDVEEITMIRDYTKNHTDLGELTPVITRQITGIKLSGTAGNPIIYASSSDNLIGGGGAGEDTNLDTNSGVLSRLTWDGSNWIKVDLIRGLPRCEENHSTNGMTLFEREGTEFMLLCQGGNTNKGAPSNNFAATPEYLYSGNVLIIDMDQLESMPIYNDPRTGTDFVYDLPTLNDPTRADIDNTSPYFPYPSGHPLYNATIDLNDPFGGHNSLNQAIFEAGSPIEVFAPGFRNTYDIVVTESGRIYLSDNGPNNTWGGTPKIYDINTDEFLGYQNTVDYDPANHYITNELSEENSSLYGDPLHFVGTINDANFTYYGGHPNPILAFPNKAGIIGYLNSGGTWIEEYNGSLESLLGGVTGYFQSSFIIEDFPVRPELGEYQCDLPVSSPENNILDVINFSTNGIAEYTATNFEGAMQGSILTASFGGDINRYVFNETGDQVIEYEAIFSGFGSIPLDVIAQGDADIFPGTVWAATYGSNSITIFEPQDIDCIDPLDPAFDPLADYDGDGFTNQDEIDNNTNYCSQGSKPNDNDGDFISDLNDDDDDNDGILDINDAFAIDADNGTTTNLPILYPFWNNDPGTGMFGLGFTGLMLDPTGSTDYLTQYDPNDLSFGGAAGKATVDYISPGDSFESFNDQQYGFQFGANVDTNSNPFTIHTRIESPYFGINGSQTNPQDFQSYGLQIGNGDQDNYLKIVIMNGISNADNINGLQVVLEEDGIVTTNYTEDVTDLLTANAIDLYFAIDPATNSAQPYYSLDKGQNLFLFGSPITLPTSFLDPTDNQGLAVGMIGTSRGSDYFAATWDFINIEENESGILSTTPSSIDFGHTPNNINYRIKYFELQNNGGPTDDPITITDMSITGTDAALFSIDATTPIVLNPAASMQIPVLFHSDGTVGTKEALLTITHDGNNNPILFDLTGELTENYSPVVRINSGGPGFDATDGGPNWEANPTGDGGIGESFVVDGGGGTYTNGPLDYSIKDPSIPDYIDQSTYEAIMHTHRNSLDITVPMTYHISVPNGKYIVNLYEASLYGGSSQPGEVVFSINMEGQRVFSHFDPNAMFGHSVAGMLQFNVTVTDNDLTIEFIEEIERSRVVAIEVLGLTFPPLEIDPLENITSCENAIADITASATGGNPADNFTYAISGQPDGIGIEPTNGIIFGQIASSSLTGGPNGDGVFNVTVTVSKDNSFDATETFTWTVFEDIENPTITCPENITEFIDEGEIEGLVTIEEPAGSDDCSLGSQLEYLGTRADGLELTDPFPLGDTIITWTVTDASGNTSDACEQTVTVEVGQYTLDLSVTLQGRIDYSEDYDIILYRTNDLVTPAYIFSETADSAGNISIGSTIGQGSYKVLVKTSLYLQRMIEVNLTENSSETIPVLLAGDANNDNIINIADLGIFSGAYGSTSGDANYSESADFNNDSVINIADLGLFSGNYFAIGEDQNN